MLLGVVPILHLHLHFCRHRRHDKEERRGGTDIDSNNSLLLILQFSERVSFFRNLQPLNGFLSFLDKIPKKGVLSQSKAKITVFVCFNGKFTS